MPSPRSPLSPYTTLFRSSGAWPVKPTTAAARRRPLRTTSSSLKQGGPAIWLGLRSEERVSRNAEPEISTLSLHDALPIFRSLACEANDGSSPSATITDNIIVAEARRPGNMARPKIGRAGQQECRARDLHSLPTRRSSDLQEPGL